MSKEAENINSLINKGTLPPINRDEVFGINTFILSSSNKSKIKEQAYKEFAEKIKKSIKENVDEAWHRDDGNGIYDAEYVLDDIDNLLKEMLGEE